MYEELINALRGCTLSNPCDGCPYYDPTQEGPTEKCATMNNAAADAIEELSDIARTVATIIENEKDMRVIESNPRWIPVAERLPEENGLYFCCWKALCDDKSWIIRLVTWRADTGWMNMYDEPMNKPITHWMTLPDPPEREVD